MRHRNLTGWALCLIALLPAAVGASTVEIPTVNGAPVITENGSARFLVQGKFRPTLAAARESAYQAAQERIREHLSKLDPPIRHVPSMDTIRREMNPHEYGPPEEQSILDSKERLFRVQIEFALQPKHVRALRERERVVSGFWALGGLLVFIGIAALLFRVDEWTKGFLTRWLIAAGIGTAVALMLTWWFVRS